MRTRKLLPFALAATLAMAGCATEEIGDEPEGGGAFNEPFDRQASPTATATEQAHGATPRTEQLDFEGSITAGDQTSDGSTVAVERAEVRGVDGWIVVHASEDGQPGAVLGTAAVTSDLEEKVVEDVEVQLDQQLPSGEHELFLMLHEDNGAVGEYEFPGPDQPIVVDGEIVMVGITLTVA